MTKGLDQPTGTDEGDHYHARTRAKAVAEFEGVTKLQALQRVLYRSAKQDPTRRFHAVYDKLARSDVMWQAWVNVATNQGAPGIDGISIADITDGDTQGVRQFLDGLAEELKSRTYRPKALRRVHIPKPGRAGETRPLGIPTVKDRVVMAAAKIVLEPIFEADFSPQSFGFRPKHSAHQALEVVRQTANKGGQWVLDADIKACFDEIDRDALVAQFERRVADREMVKLLRSWLRVGIFEGGVVTDSGAGTPQGSPISPLLANLFMHYAFDKWMDREHPGSPFERYADDVVIHCDTEAKALHLWAQLAERLGSVGLELHPEKTKVVYCKDAKRRRDYEHTSFDFLGYTFRGRMAKSRWGFFVGFSPAMSAKAKKAKGKQIRDWHLNRRTGTDLSGIAQGINPQVRGWINYYGAFYRSELYSLAMRINEHLVRWAMQKFKRLRGQPTTAWAWLDAVRQHQPNLFAHWHLLPRIDNRPVGAG